MTSRKHHICFFPGMLNLGGVGSLTINLAEEFTRQGHKVDFFLTKKKGDYLERLPKGVKIVEGKGSAFKSVFSFADYLKKEQPDVVISARDYLNLAAIFSKLIAFSRVKLVCSVHVDYSGMPKVKPSLRGGVQNLFLKHLGFYKYANHVVAVSTGVADDFSSRFNYPRSAIKVIYNPTYMPKKYSNEPSIRFTEFVNEDKPIILSVGRLTEQKNFELLIDAFSIVKKQIDCRLLILGEGHLRAALEKKVEALHLFDDVLMPGFVNNPIDYMKVADVFVMSSDYEGFGNVIVEALGAGLPIVSTDCPSGPAEILANGEFGSLVPIRNKSELSKAIANSLEEKKGDEHLINRAKIFSARNIAREYLSLFNKD